MLGRRHSSGALPSPLPSSLLKGLEPSASPSPEMSHEEALSKPPGYHSTLPGALSLSALKFLCRSPGARISAERAWLCL